MFVIINLLVVGGVWSGDKGGSVVEGGRCRGHMRGPAHQVSQKESKEGVDP